MRMLGEMAVDMPHVRSFTEFTRAALGNWAGFSVGWLYWYFWVVVIPVEAIAGPESSSAGCRCPTWQIGAALQLAMTVRLDRDHDDPEVPVEPADRESGPVSERRAVNSVNERTCGMSTAISPSMRND